jgi:hypothetical protein
MRQVDPARDRRSCGILGGPWITDRACGPCPSHGKRKWRVYHSSLDGAQTAPPTTAHKALMGFTDEEQMRKMTRLAKGELTAVVASLR